MSQLDKLFSSTDPFDRNLLYILLRKQKNMEKIELLLSKELDNKARNRNCFPIRGFSGKDADLSPEGCTGIKSIECYDSYVEVIVAGHKTFFSEEDAEGDDEYEALSEIVSSELFASNYEIDFSDDCSGHFKEILSIPYAENLFSLLQAIIEQSREQTTGFEASMARISQIIEEYWD